MFSFEELKNRKIVQWAVAYVAGAWVVLQLLDVVAEPWGIGAGLLLAAQILLAFGFFATLVLAWYHGEQGRQRVSGPELLMLAALLVIAGGVIALVQADGETMRGKTDEAPVAPGVEATSTADSIPFRSVAVLPLDNLSPAEEHRHLAGAMTEQITHALTQVPELFVPSRNSAEKFEGSGQTISDFARELGVAHVIEGSVQWVDDDVRIIVQLIDAATGEHVWSEDYERGLADLMDLQVEIAEKVAEKLASTLTERGSERIRAGSSDDPEAMDLFLRSREAIEGRNYADATRIRKRLLGEAVVHDPGFADAWAELGTMYFVQYLIEGEAALRDSALASFDRAIELAEEPGYEARIRGRRASLVHGPEEAIRLWRAAWRANPADAALIGDLARVYYDTGDFPAAVEFVRREIRFDPLSASPRAQLGSIYVHLGLDAHAGRAFERAVALASGGPGEPPVWDGISTFHRLRGQFDEARAAIDSAVARGFPYSDATLGVIDLWEGDVEGAHARLELAPRLEDALYLHMPPAAHLRLLKADTAGAQRLLSTAEDVIERLPRSQTNMYAALQIPAIRGDREAATAALRDYTDRGGRRSRWIRRDPVFDRVRADSVFEAELARLEEIVERQRRQVERDLAEDGG